MRFVCPACKGELTLVSDSYGCPACSRSFPMVCGIPDFRLTPDPYIGIEEDRAKGTMLQEAAQSRTFEELLRFYYAITPEDPPDLAKHWIERALADVEIAKFTIDAYGLQGNRLLDLGCSTGAMLAAARNRGASVTGVDVAFRWLVIGAQRLRELGVEAVLVCANAEHLPFPDSAFDITTAIDLLEHLPEALHAVTEARRVTQPGSRSLYLTNNRYAPLPDPQVRIWGVGLLPRRWQAPYVAWKRGDLHRYHVRMLSARETTRLCSRAGYRSVSTSPAVLYAPHLRGRSLQRLLKIYNAARGRPLIRALLRLVGPKLVTTALR